MRVVNKEKAFQLKFVEDLVKEVRDTYLKHLSSKLLFKMKLNYLWVYFFPTNNGTDGYFMPELYRNRINIILSVNPQDSKKYIAYIIAHEMAHMLMCEISDVLNVSGKASVIERLSEENKIYGSNLEELIADYLAHYIVSKMDLEDESGQYALEKESNTAKYEFMACFESYFGKSLMESDFIDYEIEGIQNGEANKCFFNSLWYSIATNTFDEIIKEYNNAIAELRSKIPSYDNSYNEMILAEDYDSVGMDYKEVLREYSEKDIPEDMRNILQEKDPFYYLCEKINEFYYDQYNETIQKSVATMLRAGFDENLRKGDVELEEIFTWNKKAEERS